MKNILAIASFLILIGCWQAESSSIQKKADQHLEVIYHLSMVDSIEGKYKNINYAKSISFWEDISGIKAQNKGGYYGRMPPTRKDYLNWKLWYDKNKEKLRLANDTIYVAEKAKGVLNN